MLLLLVMKSNHCDDKGFIAGHLEYGYSYNNSVFVKAANPV